MAGPMENLRARVTRQIVANLQAMGGAGRPMSLEERARRPWDLPAKYEMSGRIAREKLDKYPSKIATDNALDAMRHAEWQRDTAEAVGPIFAAAAGLAHEADNMAYVLRKGGTRPPYDPEEATPGEVWDRIQMDLHNNAEGRRAGREGRAIDPRRLQNEPLPSPRYRLVFSPPELLTGAPPR